MYQLLSNDLKKMEKQRQDVDVVRFLLSLKPLYESVRAQNLGASNLPSLLEVFSRVQHATIFGHGSPLSSKRKNSHLLDVAHCLLFHMHVPEQFWSDAVLTTCYFINRMPSSVLDGASPHSLLYPSSSPSSLVLATEGFWVCLLYS